METTLCVGFRFARCLFGLGAACRCACIFHAGCSILFRLGSKGGSTFFAGFVALFGKDRGLVRWFLFIFLSRLARLVKLFLFFSQKDLGIGFIRLVLVRNLLNQNLNFDCYLIVFFIGFVHCLSFLVGRL